MKLGAEVGLLEDGGMVEITMANIFQGKNILITGGTGSIGSEIARKILQYEPEVVRIYSNDEDGLFNLGQELRSCPNVRYLVGDVRDEERLEMAVENMDFLFHAAALKHVPFIQIIDWTSFSMSLGLSG